MPVRVDAVIATPVPVSGYPFLTIHVGDDMPGTTVRRQHRAQARIAVGYGAAGAASLVAAAASAGWVFPDVRLWIVFAAAFVLLAWRPVRVNDHLFVSTSLGVLFAAAVAFGPVAAVTGGVAMAVVGALAPVAVRKRRWAPSVIDFGRSVPAAAVGVVVFSLVVSGGGSAGSAFLPADLWRLAVASLLGSAVFVALDFGLARLSTRIVYGRTTVRSWSHLGEIYGSLVALGFVGGMLGALYVAVGSAALPVLAAVFFIGYTMVRTYGDLREARVSTIRGFVKALEAKDRYTRGHTERVARFSGMIGERMGYRGTRLERLRWAALIHDVGKLAVPRSLIRKRARLTEDEYGVMQLHVHYVDELLGDVDFLRPVVRIAANHHAHYDGNGYHGGGHAHGESPCQEACILAVADSFDAITSTRSYRVALTQPYAYAELRRHAGTQFDPGVVEAFIEGMEASGLHYGSDVERTEDEARLLAEEGFGDPVRTDPVHGPDYPFARSRGSVFDG